jgi:hypothetical protein
MPQDSYYDMPNNEALRKQIQRVRNANLPPQPQSLQEINIPIHLHTTMNGERFLAKEITFGEEKMIIFCTTSNLQNLQEADYWIMDGTFKTVPILFQQLYTIHALVKKGNSSRVLSMVYVLMTSKSEEMYKKLFEVLIELGNQSGLDLSPPFIITDFEQAAIKAARAEFPNSSNKGCFFHLCQNLWKKIQSERLANEYGNNEEFSIKLRHITALAFLPPAEIPAAFDQVKLLLPQSTAGVVQYFEENYVHGRRRILRDGSITTRLTPLFPPELWSIYELVELEYPRTQNTVEGWHNRWNNLIGKAHVGVYKIVEEMRKEQQQVDLQIESMIRGQTQPAQRKQHIERENRILSIFNDRNNRSIIEYLRGISHNISL